MKFFYQNKAVEILRISRDTLLSLEKKELIPQAKRFSNGYRYYFKEDIIDIAKFRYKDDWDKIIDINLLNEEE